MVKIGLNINSLIDDKSFILQNAEIQIEYLWKHILIKSSKEWKNSLDVNIFTRRLEDHIVYVALK